jgi:ribosomal protein S18 acetylase RimI-like enzyme
MKIRKAVITDAKAIAKVQVDTWTTTYRNIVPEDYLKQMSYDDREEMWKTILSSGSAYVAENENEEIIGFSSGGKERSGDYDGYQGEIYAIYILEEYQRNGIGKQLIKPIVKDLKAQNIFSMIVFVLEDNPSKSFYESLGGEKIDCVKTVIAGKTLNELVYGWKDIRTITF